MGGTWTQQNKKLPGAYINVKGEAPLSIAMGDRGIVAVAIDSKWGNQFDTFEITATTNTLSMLGMDFREILALNEILKNASKVIVINTASGKPAAYTEQGANPLTFTAQKNGELGNEISVVIEKVTPTGDTFNIYTYLKGQMVDRQVIKQYTDFRPNAYITISGDLTTVVDPKTVRLVDGETVPATSIEFLEALDLFKTINFNVFVNASLNHIDAREPIVSFIKELRESEGIKVQAVLPSIQSGGADYEGIIEVENGVVLDNGKVLTKEKAIYWIAGATAGANINQSNTGKVYQGAIDAYPRLTKTQMEESIDAGRIIFKADNN